MFVQQTDFDRLPYQIPNLNKLSAGTFDNYVDVKEEYMLRRLLGDSLYNSFIAGLGATPPIDPKWTNLRDGADYQVNGHTFHWNGVVDLLKPYIYSEWITDTFDTLTGIGMVVSSAENGQVKNPSRKISEAWNVFAVKAGTHVSPDYMQQFGLYPDWTWFDGQFMHDLRDTLYGYLRQTGSDGVWDGTFDDTFGGFQGYLDFWFKDPGTKNVFNI